MSLHAEPAGDPRQNKLLAALPDSEWQRLRRHLEPIEMPVGRTVRESGSQLPHAYFPTTAIISLLYATSDGASTEIAAIGNEGLVGVTLLLGGETTPRLALVQSKGWAYRIKGDILKEEFMGGGPIQHLLLRYLQALFTLIGQTAVCNRRHTIDQQLCRWLLLNLDRLASSNLVMTHELLANLMGVRREGITESARKLQVAGLITYSRGLITVIDRAGVETCCCECYDVVRQEYERLLGRGLGCGALSPHKAPVRTAAARDLSAPRDAIQCKSVSQSLCTTC
jgi:hypothetical protein